ncbi:hypothetical protein V6N12_058783 [Hibiscus sabdariffa]|uniref:Protein kinase domain-containing protein n=1 Tax=Hibiscus sabdariffa TaxID=183260 RepID=A0ABR2ET69_9ROSI
MHAILNLWFFFSTETIPKPNTSAEPAKTTAGGTKETGNNNIAAETFTFRQLATATRNFRQECLIGEGGFGRVYKGKLDKTGQVVAVKQLDRNGLQGNREFLVEVLMLSLLHHPNLVNLIGYCSDGDQRLLVYEYMPLGSLDDHLLDISPGQKPLDWYARMKIAADAAKGLEYLHDKANPPVIYRDLKPSNILLDNELNAKLSDFGLAKLGPQGDKTHAQPMFKDPSRFPELADPLLDGNFPLKGLQQAVAISAMCLQEEAEVRPLIRDVVSALSYLGNDPEANTKVNEATSGSAPTESNGSSYDDELSGEERQRAVAEAMEWGSNSRHNKAQTHSAVL